MATLIDLLEDYSQNKFSYPHRTCCTLLSDLSDIRGVDGVREFYDKRIGKYKTEKGARNYVARRYSDFTHFHSEAWKSTSPMRFETLLGLPPGAVLTGRVKDQETVGVIGPDGYTYVLTEDGLRILHEYTNEEACWEMVL